MQLNKKKKVAVLFGGRSAEHDVSLQTASNVMAHIDRDKFEVVPIAIDKYGDWYRYDYDDASPLQLKKSKKIWFSPDWIKEGNHATTHKSHFNIFDVVFPAVHGTFCEDGTLQGLLELADVPYVGCGVLSSAVGMDKDVAKRLALQSDIPVAPYIVLKRTDWDAHPDLCLKEITSRMTYPIFVKPANTGSSVGIHKVLSEQTLKDDIESAFQYDTKLLVEVGLDTQEIEIAVLESDTSTYEPFVSIAGEVEATKDFYSYDAKYIDADGALLHIPAHVSESVQEQARELAKEIFIALECEGMARIDLFFDRKTKELYFNEINTLPGFTEISMYPQLMAASGIDYSTLLTRLIQLAIHRHEKKRMLIRCRDEVKLTTENKNNKVLT